MRKKRILVRKVSNLTDARYFAAMGADWISFDLSGTISKQIINHYAEIMGWIEGPKYLLELESIKEGDYINKIPKISGFIIRNHTEENLDEQKTTFIPIPLSEFLNKEPMLLRKKLNILIEPSKPIANYSNENIAQLKEKGKSQKYLLDISQESSPSTMLMDLPGLIGFVFHGGNEERTGMKSYEEIDKWFDLIMESN